MLAHSFLIESSWKLLVTKTGIKARTSSILGVWFPWPIYMFFEMRIYLGTLDSGERSLPFGLLVYYTNGPSSIMKVAGNQDRHKSSDKFDFGPLVSMAHLYLFWNEIWPWHIGLRWVIVALCATCLVYQWSVVHLLSSIVIVIVHTFKLECLWSQLANIDQILWVASLGWGKGCIRFWDRLDQNSGFHGNRKPPLTYNGKNDVSTFSRLFLMLAGNEDMHKISNKFEFRPDRTTDYGVSCLWASEYFPIDL